MCKCYRAFFSCRCKSNHQKNNKIAPENSTNNGSSHSQTTPLIIKQDDQHNQNTIPAEPTQMSHETQASAVFALNLTGNQQPLTLENQPSQSLQFVNVASNIPYAPKTQQTGFQGPLLNQNSPSNHTANTTSDGLQFVSIDSNNFKLRDSDKKNSKSSEDQKPTPSGDGDNSQKCIIL